MAASSSDDRGRFGATWLALLAGLFVLLAMPADLRAAPAWQRGLAAPATALLELASRWVGAKNQAFLPVVAALELVALGLLVDLVRGALARRAGRPSRRGLDSSLAPWIGLLVTSFAAALFASVYLRYLEQPALEGWAAQAEVQERRVELKERIRELRADERAGERIVWIGDSMSVAALLEDLEVEALLAAAGHPVRFAQLSAAGADLFELEPLLEEVLAIAPDRLVLEVNMLFLKFVPTIKRLQAARASRWASKRAKIATLLARLGIVGPGLHDPGGLIAGLPRQDAAGEEARRELEKIMSRWRNRRAIADDPCFLFARRLIERAQEAGIDCELAVIPVADSVGRAVPVFFTDRQAMANELAQELGIPLRIDAPTWPDNLYHDGSHMRHEGSRMYTETVVELLYPTESSR